ncbi:hypothetical protein [Oerskovia sp. KBS0722]|uniref:hypothetical protein n=1 Tax=Oerskovia sp. KBS0722 TaxID=1179673 RepID=UPI00110D56EA|nr:hypothetical protein [Oerskovia sp. KBS0722]QDW62541.1 hypothetical protein FFI11_008315 [Oerskovia sp. KBS0722]
MTTAGPSDGRPDVGAAVLPYRESGGGYGRAAKWVAVPTAVAFLVDAAIRGWWDASVWIMIGMIVGFFVLLTVFSTRRYQKIVVDHTGLRAGRDHFPAVTIDPSVVAHVAAHGPLHEGERLPDGTTVVGGKLVGGAYAPTLGAGILLLRLTDGSWVRVQCSKPQQVVAALQVCLVGAAGVQA